MNQGSMADDGARTFVFGLKILVQQLPGERCIVMKKKPTAWC